MCSIDHKSLRSLHLKTKLDAGEGLSYRFDITSVQGTWLNRDNLRRACVARVAVLGLSVCPSVTTFSATTLKKQAQKMTPMGSELHWLHFKILCSKVVVWKPSEWANMLISTDLPRLGPLPLCIMKAQEVTIIGVYRLPHAIYCCSWPVSDSMRAS